MLLQLQPLPKADAGVKTPATGPASNLEAALRRAEQGFYVFPCRRGTKIPITSSKKYPSERSRWGATADPARIQKYWKKWPHANIGIETGYGFFVVEADTIEGHPSLKPGEGVAALDKLVAEQGGWPETRMAESPTGSRHYYFTHGTNVTIKAGCKLAPGVEVLGEGNMVIVPPSVRIKDGKLLGEYRWLNKLPIAEAPAWLIKLIKKDKRKRSAPVADGT
jgi:hypothetical protein